MSGTNGVGVVRFIRDAAGAGADATPDADLVRRFAATADEQAFRVLVARHGPVVWAVCRRMLRNHHDAEDAFQATFLVFARSAGDIRSGAAVAGWLCGVAARVASRVRSARRPESANADAAVGHPDGPLGELTVREAEAVVHEELARLPEKYRAVLVLCCLEGSSRDETADRLGWTENQVRNCLEQGREQLRSRLARRGISLGLPLSVALLKPATTLAAPLIDSAVLHATGATVPPAAVSSLAHGVTRSMWIAKWEWAVAASAVLALTGGGILAAGRLREAPTPAAEPAPSVVRTLAPAQPAKPAEPKAEVPKRPWDVATEFLQFIIDDKPEQARKLGNKLDERHIKEMQVAGLKRVRAVMILLNDSRALVVTERAKLVRRPGAEATDDHALVELERKDGESPWLVRATDVADEKSVWREVGDYLEAKFDLAPRPAAPEKGPKPAWSVAEEFLKLALVGKTADALKLTVPGTVSENKVGEAMRAIFSSTAPVAVLINDARVEVVFQQQKDDKGNAGHLVLMLTKAKDGVWQVKDIDFRDQKGLGPRVNLYLAGNYDEMPKKE